MSQTASYIKPLPASSAAAAMSCSFYGIEMQPLLLPQQQDDDGDGERCMQHADVT
jgi:hypothetical protein